MTLDNFKMDDILGSIDIVLRSQGFAGSTNIPKIVFLTALTRHFDDPVSLVVMGPSGAGKTYSIESGLQLVDPDAIESISGMSEKALPYLKGVTLKNRILYLGEAAGMGGGNGRTFLRQLMTEGKIDYLTVQKTTKGFSGEKLDTVEGPICFMMATTANSIHHEDQSRMLVLHVDEDPSRIAQSLVNRALGRSKATVNFDRTPWMELQQSMSANSKGVVIPYAEAIAKRLPPSNPKISRDFPKLLNLVRACALVHRNYRQHTDDGSVIATLKDYSDVYGLINAPLSHGLGMTVRDGIKEVVKAVEELSALSQRGGYDGISQSLVAEHTLRDRSVVVRNVKAAIEQGYLGNLTPGQGREARLVIGDRKLPSGSVLPDPETLLATADA